VASQAYLSGSAASEFFLPRMSRLSSSICSCGGGKGLTPAAGSAIALPRSDALREPRFAQRISRTAIQIRKETKRITPPTHASGSSAFIRVIPLLLNATDMWRSLWNAMREAPSRRPAHHR
jgi:hypothetical protein